MELKILLEQYRPGSYDWTWPEEFAEIEERLGDDFDQLARDIQENGIKEPILLGDDGRIWDGHTRLTVASKLGLESVPTVEARSKEELGLYER